jgi:uncharacterized membrane protein
MAYYITATPGVMAGTAGTWLMSADSAPQPGLALRILEQSGGQSGQESAYLAGAPELIVEVSHTTASKDAGEKRRLYERSGVREYIRVRPERRQIIWRALRRRKYAERAPGKDGWYRSRISRACGSTPSHSGTATSRESPPPFNSASPPPNTPASFAACKASLTFAVREFCRGQLVENRFRLAKGLHHKEV